MRRRAQFSQFITSNTSLTINRYFRLMSLATIELLFNIPLSVYGLYLNITGRPFYKWKSWADIHSGWYTIDVYPAKLWRSNQQMVVNFELSRWSLIFCALIFFAFFGFADEARKNYRAAYWAVAKRFGITPQSASSGSKVLAGYVPFYYFINLWLTSFRSQYQKEEHFQTPRIGRHSPYLRPSCTTALDRQTLLIHLV